MSWTNMTPAVRASVRSYASETKKRWLDGDWYLNGELYSSESPPNVDVEGELEIVTPFGDTFWARNGRVQNWIEPAVRAKDGSLEWCHNGLSHRFDGPSHVKRGMMMEDHGFWQWDLHGLQRRLDDPSRIYVNGGVPWYNEVVKERMIRPGDRGDVEPVVKRVREDLAKQSQHEQDE